MIPMYLVGKSPQMLPTTTLDSKPAATAKSKRHSAEEAAPFISMRNLIKMHDLADPDRWWWLGVAMTSVGGIALLYS